MVQKNLKTAIVLAFIAGLGILGYSIVSKWYDIKYGETDRSKLTDNLTEVEYNNGEIGILNNTTGKVVGRYNKVLRTFRPEEPTHLIMIVVKNNLRGYISAQTGEVIFEPQFLYAWVDDLESGLAACVNKDHKLGFVNVRTKEIAIPFQFDFDGDKFVHYNYYSMESFPILDFVFSNGICIIPGKAGKIGMIDQTGKLLLPAIYSDIINWRDANTPNIILKRKPFFVGIGIFSEYCNGYVKITEILQNTPASAQGDLKVNDVILKIKQEGDSDYKDVTNMPHEDVLNLIGRENYETGTKVTLLVKHENGSTQDITIVRDKIINDNSDYEYMYGVCNRNFEMILPFDYNSFEKNWEYANGDCGDCFDEEDSRIIVINYIVSKDGKYGILDTLFKEILPIKYDNIKVDLVNHKTYIVQKNDKYGVLDSTFKTVLPIEFDRIGTICIDDDYDNTLYIAKKDYVQKLYDDKGKLLNDFYIKKREGEYDYDKEEYVEKSVFEPVFEPNRTTLSKYIRYYLDGYSGIVDDSKKVVIPAKYHKIEYLGNGNFACTEDEYSFLFKDKNNH
jgi:hypothetical protein